MRMAWCLAGSGLGFVTLIPLLWRGRICSHAGRRLGETLGKSFVERGNQLRIAGLAFQTPVDLDAGSLEKTNESIEARPHICLLQSFQRPGKKATRRRIYFRIEPGRKAGRLAAFLHVRAALVF